MSDVAYIPISGQGLDAAQLEEALAPAALQLQLSSSRSQSLNMDPDTATAVVGVATAIPALITSIVGAWTSFRNRISVSPRPTVVIETTTDDISVSVGDAGTLLGENGAELDPTTLPQSPKDILR